MENLKKLAKQTRRNIIKMVYGAQSGHIGGAMSAADILTVLYHKVMTKDDRFVLSKGHASAALYSVLSQRGYFPESELMTFRKLGSRLQGHPALICPGVHVATGSLGQGLSIACGIAMALKLDKKQSKVFVLLGDGELQEGSVWEGFMHGSHRGLDNIIAIVDRNNLQIDGCTENVKAIGALTDKIKAFGWDVQEIDGHDLDSIYSALETAKKSKGPAAIIANTIKGKGVSFMENNAGWHGTAPKTEECECALKELD